MDGWWNSAVLAQTSVAGWQFFLIAVLVFVVPFVAGNLLAQALRLRDLGFRMGVVLFSIVLSLAPFLYQEIAGWRELSERKASAQKAAANQNKDDEGGDKPAVADLADVPRKNWKTALHLGIDLAGGTNLIYQIDREKAEADEKSIDKATLDKLVGAVGRRINPGGAEEVTVRRVGEDRIEVIIPGADQELVTQKKRAIVNLGSLEFAILANEKDHRQIIADAKKLLRPDQDNLMQGGRMIASYRTVAEGKDKKGNTINKVNPQGGDRAEYRTVSRTTSTGETKDVMQFLVVHEPADRAVTGKYLTRAAPSMDENGQICVSFTFNARGGALFWGLTGRYQPDKTDGFHRRLGVLLNGELHTAPNLNSRIGNSGQIMGQFTQSEVNELINVLNAGALEVPLKETPVSEFSISPLLGIDVQKKGMTAILSSAAVVVIFMVVYYGVAGVVADLSLMLNLLLVVGSMAFIEATFTLPGLAGIVLTVGMAVDSNVLIYERMREELAKGASLRMAIENGFDKAFSAIFDGNVTSLLTAAILYMIGSDQIRGFAVSLFIGLSMSMFSVLFFGHLCFHILERKRWITTLKMRQFVGVTKIDFLKQRGWAFALSAAVIVLGFVALIARGDRNMDIDFTGGTMVTFEFTEPQETEVVRDKLAAAFKSPISVERLVRTDEQTTATQGHRFRMRTTLANQTQVTEAISKSLSGDGMALVKVTASFTPPTAIPTAEPDKADRFSGGHQSTLTFKDGSLGTATAATYLGDALRKIQADGKPKYDAVDSLIAIEGTEVAAKDPNSPSTSKKFTAAVAKAAPQVSEEDFKAALAGMEQYMADNPSYEEVNAFDTLVSGEMQRDAILAIVASLIVVVIYIWYRFEKVYYGIAAVIALAHDVLVTLGSVAIGAYLSQIPLLDNILLLDDFKINLALIASLLTIVGYSLNDTIVIFDRIREIKGKNPNITYDMINLAVNQTLARTLLTALTSFMVVTVLYIAGGDGIHGFAFSMLIGIIAGCYSTVYIANPILLWLVQREQRLKATATTKFYGTGPVTTTT